MKGKYLKLVKTLNKHINDEHNTNAIHLIEDISTNLFVPLRSSIIMLDKEDLIYLKNKYAKKLKEEKESEIKKINKAYGDI